MKPVLPTLAALLVTPALVVATDLRFDIATFNASPEGSADHMTQTLYNDLNFRDIGGHYMGLGTDAHRPETEGNGNQIAAYLNSLTNEWTRNNNATAAADYIHFNYVLPNYTAVAPKVRPTWIVLNEISSSLWQNTTDTGTVYRQWLVDLVTRLHDSYGYEVLLYSPFATPANASYNPIWQAITAKGYIGVENYLSGEEVRAQNYSVAWCQSQYQLSINAYASRGVDKSRLILGEEFASTTSGTAWGRAGVSAAEWEQTIRVRSQALYNLDFAGFIGYAWGKNAMLLSDAELLAAEDAYRSTMVLHSEKPQWLATGGGSWSTRNNWLAYDTVPSGIGAVATFDRTILSPATITVDAPRTIGTLTFNSVNRVTLSPGTAGSLTFNNGVTAPSITVSAGSHTLAVPLSFTAPATLTIAAGAQLDITNSTLVLSPSTPVRQYLLSNQLTSSTPDPGNTLSLGYFTSGPSTLVKLALTGDTNLDGKLNADDYAALDRGFAKHLSTWQDGDFDYDGQVTSADYALIDRTFLLSHALGLSPDFLAARESQFGTDYVSALVTAVPEPVPFYVLVSLTLVACAARRPRSP